MPYSLSPTQKILRNGLALLETAALAALDQWTKFLAARHLKGAPDVVVIPNVLSLSYVENRGAAWGMLPGMRWLFLALTALALAGVAYLFFRLPQGRRYLWARVLLPLFAAGALGNAIDRLFLGYVVDFFCVTFLDFPVFNCADCFVCVSLFLLLFLYRNEEFAWLKKKS